MTFQWPNVFWLLLLPAVFALAELFRRVRSTVRSHPKILRAEASPSGLRFLPDAASTPIEQRVRWRLWLGLSLAVVASARPQWGEIEEPVFEQSREILIAVDLSRSMLAPDVAPSRLERSKLLITSLLEKLAGERVGLIVFAGTAFLQSPLSADYEILREFLPSLDPDYLPEGGTDYAAMLDTALDAFSKDSGADRYLIILSDGESQTEAWEQRVDDVREREIHIIGLGIGTPAGAMLPDGAGGLVKDERGAVVLSRLNPATLEDLSRRTGGVYRDASSWVDLAEILQQTVETGRQGAFAETRSARRIERFQWALAPALLLLLWSVWREFPVQSRLKAVTVKTARAGTRAAAIALVVYTTLILLSPDSHAVEKVNPVGDEVPRPQQATEPQLGPPKFNPKERIKSLVAELAGRDNVTPREFANLYSSIANSTVIYGNQMLDRGQKPETGAIKDSLDAVDAGESIDPHVTDWAELRSKLERFLDEEPQEQQSDNDQQDQDGEGDQDKQDGENGDPDKDSSGEQGEQDQEDQQGENGENKDSSQDESGSSGNDQQEGKGGEQQDNQEPAGGDQDKSDEGHRPPENRESAFGDLDEPQQQPEPDEAQQAQPRPQPQDRGTQTVGGQPTRNTEATDNPALAMPLQKLDQLKQQDSPAQLFQLMQDPANATPKVKGRDW